jgi:16S rRNA processing protein RimM
MVVMARIGAPFGIKGWVKLQTFTEYADSLDEFDVWYQETTKGWEEIEVEDFAVNNKGTVAKLKGCDDRTSAELLKKRNIAVPRDWLGEAKDGEYFWIDLVGSEVVNTQGERFGRIETLMETGANDVLVVKLGTQELLIPFVADVIVKVDREAKQVTVNWSGEFA